LHFVLIVDNVAGSQLQPDALFLWA